MLDTRGAHGPAVAGEHADRGAVVARRRRGARRRPPRRARRRTPRRSRRRPGLARSRSPARAPPSAGATTRSARPSCAAIQARRAPVGDQRGSATEPERATIAGVITRHGRTLQRRRRDLRSCTPDSDERTFRRSRGGRAATTRLAPRRSLGHPGPFMPGDLSPDQPRPQVPVPGDPLRIAFLIYRGNPHCGGQGVYSRHLTRELAELGHAVTMFAGQPWPVADPPVTLEHVPGLDLYRPREPVPGAVAVRVPQRGRPPGVRDHVHGRVPRAVRVQPPRRTSASATAATSSTSSTTTSASARGLLGFLRDGWPFVNTLHHPITVDRDLELAHATNPWRKFTLRRWYGFLGMQMRGRPAAAAPSHRVGELAEGHRRPDGCRRRHAARRPGRRRPDAVPADAARRARAGPADDDRERRRAAEGTPVPHRGAGQGPHRTAPTRTSSSSAGRVTRARSRRRSSGSASAARSSS